ncbi:uncharacterized protein LY89DRAFT_684411 [Mollisia scopiformis]|uniref:Protein kinase domain-containing protein n=1 Tax=Mollisia scopiformis TaxID=149040 RepID=A0A194XAZ4_MOLSC|nr:uncharacterized protein LY89DRAFT_684411 [Mollisia scopiformis]KUJ17341.1 hypothetical protein LY89DRAFT_684411 [Mollisia scopiformis]
MSLLMRMYGPRMSSWMRLCFLLGAALASAQRASLEQNTYRFPNAEVLATQQKFVKYGHPLRVVVNDAEKQAIKYVFLDSNKLQGGYSTNSEEISIDLPSLPPGDWNEAHIYLDGRTGAYTISNTTLTNHLEMKGWYPRRIEYLDFVNVETLQQDRLQVVTHPNFEAPVLIKIASFPWEMPSLEQEAIVYQLLYGSGATPEFLGHVTESGRIIGFITEYIEEIPSIRDRNVHGCIAALRKLHHRGIAHGDAHDGNCLIRKDGSAVIIDFELSLETSSHQEFERDLDIMGRCLIEAVSERS